MASRWDVNVSGLRSVMTLPSVGVDVVFASLVRDVPGMEDLLGDAPPESGPDAASPGFRGGGLGATFSFSASRFATSSASFTFLSANACNSASFSRIFATAYSSFRYIQNDNYDLGIIAILFIGSFIGIKVGIKYAYKFDEKKIKKSFSLVVSIAILIIVIDFFKVN